MKNTSLILMVIILLSPMRAVSEEVPSKIIDCSMVAELAANEDEYYAGIFAVTIYLRGLMDGAKNGFSIDSHNLHTKVVDTWLDAVIDTCDRKMSSKLYKVAKRLR
jgi:hypothetical protein